MTLGVIHYEPNARRVGECRCGGILRFVGDFGAPRPIEAQCEACGVLTGVARDWSPQTSLAAPQPQGDQEDWGF